MKLNKKVLNALRIIVSITIIFYLFSRIGIQETVATISTANLTYVALTAITLLGTLLIAYGNLFVLVKALKKYADIPTKRIFRGYSLSYAIGNFVPGKFGELSMAYFLHKDGMPLGSASMVTLLDRIISSGVMIILAIFGIGLFIGWNSAIQIFVIAAIAGIIGFSLFFTRWGTKFISNIFFKNFFKRFKGFYQSFRDVAAKGYPIPLNILGTIVQWGLNAVVMWFLFSSLGVEVGLLHLYLIPAIITTIVLIPISIAGLGLRESAAVFFFGLVGVDQTITLSAYILLAIIRYTYAGLALLIFNRSDKSKTANTDEEIAHNS